MINQQNQREIDALQHAKEIVRSVPIAMFTTVADDGSLHSRPMVNVNRDFDDVLWFITNRNDPKVGEIGLNDNTNVSFSSPDLDGYVSAAGKAILVQDSEQLEQLWSERCGAWFQNGPNDDDLRLIKFEIQSIAYWDREHSAMIAVGNFVARLLSRDPAVGQKSAGESWSSETADLTASAAH